MNTAYFYLTDEGGKLAHKLAAAHPGDIYNSRLWQIRFACLHHGNRNRCAYSRSANRTQDE